MTPLAVIRPQPGCDSTVAAARALGLDARGFPLFTVRSLAWEAPGPGSFDALLIGSANALRHGGAALARYTGKPVYAVGESTAETALGMGFAVAAVGEDGLHALLDKLAPQHRRLLWLCGRERVAFTPPDSLQIVERTVYASDPLAMPRELAGLLAKPAVVLLHSAEAARHFAGQCADNGIARERIALAALGPRIASAAGTGWAAVEAATRPRDDALLALAKQMCQTGGMVQG